MSRFTEYSGGYRIEKEWYSDQMGVNRSREISRIRLAPTSHNEPILDFIGSIWLYTLLFLLLAWGVVSLVGNLGFLVLLVAAPILYVSFSRRMAGVRRFLRGTVSGIREWVADRV